MKPVSYLGAVYKLVDLREETDNNLSGNPTQERKAVLAWTCKKIQV